MLIVKRGSSTPSTQAGNDKLPFYFPHLRPAALFIHGKKSPISVASRSKARLESCGTAPGGSGGVELGRVKGIVLAGGHFLPFEMVSETAKVMVDFLVPGMGDWKEAEMERLWDWNKLSVKERQTIGDEVLKNVKASDQETVGSLKSLSSKM